MEKKQILVIVIVAVVIISGAFVLMNNSKEGNSENNRIPDSDYYPVTVTTQVGGVELEQVFEEAPQRILAVWNANVELLCYFGLEDRVVSAYADNDYITLYDDLQSKYDAVDKMSTKTFSVEKVRSLDVDLILGWSSTFGDSYLGSVSTWNGYGTNCIVTNRPSATVDDYLSVLSTIGKIFNMQDEANKKIAEFTSSYDDIRERTTTLTDDQKISALLIEPGYDGGCFVYGSSFLSGDLITQAGGVNLFKEGMVKLTFEQIASYSPDIIFIMSGSGSSPLELQEAVNMFTSIPGFASMTDNIVPFGFYEVYMGGLLPDDIIDRMFEAMYPE